MSELTVKAAAGVRVPCEENPRKYITDDATVTVEATAYYLRQLKAGDLVCDANESPPAPSEAQLEPASVAPVNVKKNKEVTDGQS